MKRSTAAVIVFIAALALYLPALRNGFAYDDVAIIQGDPRVHSLSNLTAFFSRGYWADAELALYRPLTSISFAVDWALSGGMPAWFHAVNALLHATVCVLVLLLLAQLTTLPAALAGALVFAVHPVHVEAVANVVGRAELIAAAFVLGAILLWPGRGSARSRMRLTAVTMFFALALLAKESAIMLPALLVLVDVGRGDLRSASAATWLRARAAQLLVLGTTAVGYLALRAYVLGGIAPSRVDAALEVATGADRIMTALQAWVVYVRLMFAPVVLLADYGPRVLMPAHTATPSVIAGFAILAALVLGGTRCWLREQQLPALALLWFPVAVLPVSNLIVPIGIIVAERTLYLPSLALSVGAVIAVQQLAGRRAQVRPAAITAYAIILALFSVRTTMRIPEWRSTDTVFAALLRDRPDSFRAQWHQARLASVAGQPQRALELYAHALELWPYRTRLVIETIRAAARAGEPAYARQLAAYAASQWPDNIDVIRLHAAATLDSGDTAAALGITANALRRFPQDSLLLRMHSAVSGDTTR